MNQPEFGIELVKIRKSKGLTQSELADKCGVTYRTIQRLESGKVLPRNYTLNALSAALDYNFQARFKDDSTRITKQVRILDSKIIQQIIDLFNLKTNTMKKVTLLSIIIGLIGFGLFVLSNKSNAQSVNKPDFSLIDSIKVIPKDEAIKRIKEINRVSLFHNKSIEVIETYAKDANYNFDTFVFISELIGNFGHSTKPAMEIANIAFLSNKECDIINEIVALLFLNNHGSNDIYVKLAREASEAKTTDDLIRIKEQINKYRNQAEFKTLEEAYNKQPKN